MLRRQLTGSGCFVSFVQSGKRLVELACRFQDFLDVAGNFHSTPFFHQLSIPVNEESAAFDTPADFSVTGFGFHHIEAVAEFFFRI